MRIYKATYAVTLASLLVAVALNGWQLATRHPDKTLVSLDLGINVVASSFYALILLLWNRPCLDNRVRSLRYIDWSLTLPLLTLILFRLRRRRRSMNRGLILVLVIGMVACGFLGRDRIDVWFLLGSGFFAGAMWLLKKEMLEDEEGEPPMSNKKRRQMEILYYGTVTLWSAYGVVYLVPKVKPRNVAYNVLDCLSKSVFAYLLTAGVFQQQQRHH